MPVKNRPRRSCLYMPGSNTRALEKARALDADVLILDLEDAVAPESKVEARQNVVKAVSEKVFGYREVIVRINELGSEWGEDDLQAVVAAEPDGVLFPKVVAADQVKRIDQSLTESGASEALGLWVMIEMPLAILNLAAIAEAAQTTRLCGFVLGTNDLAKEMNCVVTADRLAFLPVLSQIVIAARAYGLSVIDGVFNQLGDDSGLESECLQGLNLGFDGKSLIHPGQLETSNRIFSPSAEAVAQAQAVIDAFNDPANQDVGVIKVNGKMTERLHLEQAEALVEKAKLIASMTQ